MAKIKGGEQTAKLDDLEIVSIGSLYKGPWEKKYWSSSRGKDRYPYPVGYQAVRAHNGSTYKTEIHEGPRGPLFVISCDGQSCSGQTPDIAWEKFQKMGCSHLKIWHGKRFSCKIDGVEFFGFKNPFVQRLLRELVANVNGTAERSLLSSSFCNGASRMDNDNGSSTVCTASDLLPYLARPQIRKKRSTRCEKMQSKLVDRPGLKRPRSKDLTYDAEDSNLVPGNQVKHEHGFLVTHNASEDEIDRFPEASAVHSTSAGKIVESSPAKDGFPSKSVDFVAHHGENEAKGKFISSQNEKFTRLANIAYKELDRSQDTVLEGFCFPKKTDDRPEDSSFPNDSMGINDVHLYAPDTLDFEDDRTNVASGAKDITGSMKEELITTNMVNSDGLVTESHQEEEIGTSNSNTGSEKSEFDSVGQEMAKLMMTVLLPQAVPLLKESSKKKKETISPCNVLRHVMNSREDNIVTNHLLNLPSSEDACTEQDTRMHIQGLDHGLVVPNLEHLNSVILDSFENSQGGDHVASQAILFSKSMEVNQTSFNKEAFDSNIQEQLVSIKPNQETRVCCGESCGDQDTICHKEVNMAESALECAFPIMKTLSEDIQGVSITLDENSADIGNHSKQKKPKNALNCAEVVDANDINSRGIASSLKLSGKDSSAETRAPTTNSSHQDQNKVYTRKKISKQAYSTRKYVGPLSESIICRNSGDGYAPNNSAMPGTSPVSKSCHSSDDKPCNRDVFGNTPMLEEQSCGLPVEKTAAYCKPEINNMPPILSNENQKLTCASKKDASCLLNQSVSLERGYQENCYKERFIVENGCSASCQNQVTSFCDKNLSTAMEVQGGSGVNHHGGVELSSDLRGIVNLVGGYFHPLPISSVLLGTKGNEIHICVSCGLLVDTDRTLFIYKVATEEPRKGCPSFVGYTSVVLPSSEKDVAYNLPQIGNVLFYLTALKHLIAGCSKENAVKIVRVNPGYVSLVAKLETVESVLCILVCENDYLLAAGKSGRLYLWAMNSTWSAWREEFIIPSGDCISACVVELKRIPKDILKRVNISRYSGSGDPIKQFLPIGLLSWQPVFSYDDMKERIDEITTSTKFWFSKHKDSSFLPLEGKDVAIWLLVLTNSDAQHEHLSSNHLANTSRWWRLALLVKDTMILGSTLDPRAATVSTSLDHGIMGRDDGLVYMWELSTGTRLGVLHHFKGGRVSCIATDESRPEVVAVAADDGQLLLYLHNQENSVKK
ncbi:DNA binding protein [Gossypium australe]|uniref:DNA binding protein n=1 Tax=Gossypium australe TaxID=47621 RepID=A0A5B6UZL6_9ROSI|nr:DNA binding protein [Gossypium australe]